MAAYLKTITSCKCGEGANELPHMVAEATGLLKKLTKEIASFPLPRDFFSGSHICAFVYTFRKLFHNKLTWVMGLFFLLRLLPPLCGCPSGKKLYARQFQ